MGFAERLYFFRLKNNLTQKALGIKAGFPEKNADVRIAQYETGGHMPKPEVIARLALALNVVPAALTTPNIDSDIGVMNTLFALEDTFGFRVVRIDDKPCLTIDPTANDQSKWLEQSMNAWCDYAEKLARGEITQEEYDNARYHNTLMAGPLGNVLRYVGQTAFREDHDFSVRRRAKKIVPIESVSDDNTPTTDNP